MKALVEEITSLVHDTFEAALVCLTVGSLLAVVILLTDPAIWR